MGSKLVRDRNEEWCRAHGVPGQWFPSPDPAAALREKMFEEAGEYAADGDAAELYDLRDVIEAAIDLADPHSAVPERWRPRGCPEILLFREICRALADYTRLGTPFILYDLLYLTNTLITVSDPGGSAAEAHAAKVEKMGGFLLLMEWTPVPAGAGPSDTGRLPRLPGKQAFP